MLLNGNFISLNLYIRLFFLNEVSNQYLEITKLSKIKDIDTFEMNGMFYGVLNGVKALTLDRKGILICFYQFCM